MDHLATHHQGQDDYQAAYDYAWRQVALDPLREEAHRQVMRSLAASGHRSQALAQYESCRQTLADELGVEPSQETTALYEQIRDSQQAQKLARPGQVAPEISPRPPAPPRPRHNLPARITPLVGREAELAALPRLLNDPDQRLITILGPSGIGKTRLAVETAAAQMAHYTHGVYLVRLAPLESADLIVSAIVEALNFPLSGRSSPKQQLIDYLRQKQMLLVLDNFEHLLSGSPPLGEIEGGPIFVTELLQAAPDLKILVTSRARLQVQGEQLFPLEGIEVPRPGEATLPTEALQTGAIRLFLQSARRLVPDFEITAENVRDVIQICRLVEGTPLAILLAAAWVAVLTPAEILAEIGRGFDFLASDLRDVEARQQSLRAVFGHSWRLLTEREQTIFAQLSVFRGGFTREAAAAVTEASPRDLLALVNKSLLHHTPAGRYEIHELLRQYAEEHLNKDKVGETGAPADENSAVYAVRHRHSAYYTTFLQQREADLKGARQQAALAEILADGENVRTAWQWAAAQGQIEWLDRALESLGCFYEWRGRNHEGKAACQLAIEKLESAQSVTKLRVLVRLFAWQGTFSRRTNIEQAEHLVRQSLALLGQPELAQQDTRSEQAFALRQMGVITAESDYQEALRLYQQSLRLYQALGDDWATANVQDVLGWTFQHLGQPDKAVQLLSQSLELRGTLDDKRGIANSLHGLSYLALSKGQLEEAEQMTRQSLALFREIGDRGLLARGLLNLGTILVRVGKFSEGQSLLGECLQVYEDLGLPNPIALSNTWQGYAKMHLGRYEQARTQLQKGLTLFRKIGNPTLTGLSLRFLALVLLTDAAYAEASSLFRESDVFPREQGYLTDLSYNQAMSAYAAYGLGNLPQAQQHLAEALRIAVEIRFVGVLFFALPAIALLLAEWGEPERAVELYTLPRHHFLMVANSRWFEEIVGQHITAAVATLPPQVVAAAQARGRARDLWETAEALLVELEGE